MSIIVEILCPFNLCLLGSETGTKNHGSEDHVHHFHETYPAHALRPVDTGLGAKSASRSAQAS